MYTAERGKEGEGERERERQRERERRSGRERGERQTKDDYANRKKKKNRLKNSHHD